MRRALTGVTTVSRPLSALTSTTNSATSIMELADMPAIQWVVSIRKASTAIVVGTQSQAASAAHPKQFVRSARTGFLTSVFPRPSTASVLLVYTTLCIVLALLVPTAVLRMGSSTPIQTSVRLAALTYLAVCPAKIVRAAGNARLGTT